jgi:hypothetical protein
MFGHLLKSVDCTDNGMVVEFEDTRAFGYTQRGWQFTTPLNLAFSDGLSNAIDETINGVL